MAQSDSVGLGRFRGSPDSLESGYPSRIAVASLRAFQNEASRVHFTSNLMMDLRKLLGLTEPSQKQSSLLEALSAELQDCDEQSTKFISGLCGLLGQVMYCDLDISEDEVQQLQEILQDELSLSPEILEHVVTIVTTLTKELAGIEDHQYTRMINECSDREKRLHVLRVLFRIATADRTISTEEEHCIGNIATGMALSRKDYLNARAPFVENLESIQGLSS